MKFMPGKILILFVLGLLTFCAGLHAQDTSKRKTINITSTFKPVLRDAVKINFNAAPPVVDSTRPKLNYLIPSQYLFLNYQPSTLNPVALQVDSLLAWRNDNYIKAGIGNVHQPYLKAGFSFGDGQSTFFNAFAEGYASKGSLPYQKNDLADIGISGTVKTKNNLEWSGGLGFKNQGYYLYGFQPDTLKFDKDNLKQRFQTFNGKFGLRNTVPTEFGLTYNPTIQVDVFSDNHSPKASEANTVLNLPLQKTLNKQFSFDLGLTASLTNYRLNSVSTINNNYYLVSPALIYKNGNLNLHAEMTPSWDNKNFHLLPNIWADLTTNNQQFTLQLGWVGYYEKGSYQRYEGLNPWLAQPTDLLNTRVQEFYGGFKGSLNNHISYAAKLGFAESWNIPLFVNDSIDGKTFVIRYDHLQDFKMHGEITYTQGEQFNITAGVNINQYTNIKKEQKAWGLLPFEFTTALRWQILKDLWLKSDLWAFDGAPYLDKDGSSHTGDRGLDLNAGVEFRITKQVNLWFQMNNIFNNKYERWHQYQVYGINILGGVIFSFAQK